MELAELNACHQGAADWYRFEINRLERIHFERCYQAPTDGPVTRLDYRP